MILVNQIKVSLKDYQQSADIGPFIVKKLKIKANHLIEYKIQRQSIDARKKDDIALVFSVLVQLKDETSFLKHKHPDVLPYQEPKDLIDFNRYRHLKHKKIAIIGFGPAGIFSALTLSRAGVKVTVYERGEDVDTRIKTIKQFESKGILNPESNIQFGEGGAGTYSDGKLTSRKRDALGSWLFNEMVLAGAPKEILYDAFPHVGSDKIRQVVKNIRKEIITLGSKVLFNSLVTSIKPDKSGINLTVNDAIEHYDECILAIGHSSRDTIEMLYHNQCQMVQKPFAVGFRIEHPQCLINQAQFGFTHNHHILGAAEYRLTHKTKDGKGVYTFCMCPGGMVVPASTEKGMVVTNGMSDYARDRINANSALLVTVDEHDFLSDHPLAGIEFQRRIERKAFELGGNHYHAPIQRLEDFIHHQKTTKLGSVLPSYPIGVTFANLRQIYSESINLAMVEAISRMGQELKGFNHPDALLTGVETRSSSPVRILRDSDSLQSVSFKHLYPTGEGAGYAGGIVSAAIDGMKVALKILDSMIVESS